MGSPWKKSRTRAKPVRGGFSYENEGRYARLKIRIWPLKEGQSGRGWDPQKETISTQNNGIRSQNELDILFAHFPKWYLQG